MGRLDNRIIILRDDRINVKDKHLYYIIKEVNVDLTINNTNKIHTFIKCFDDDDEAINKIDYYNNIINNSTIEGIDKLINLLFIKEITTLDKLSYVITTYDYEDLDTFIINNNYIYSRDGVSKINKVDNEYEILYKNYILKVNPKLSLMKQYILNNKNYIKYLLINSFPDNLELVIDTNPDRNILTELI